jgi:flagellar biosynthesis protein FliR
MPALVAFFIATITIGLVTRTMPQLAMMSLGITLNLLVGFVMVGIGLAGWALVSQRSFAQLFVDLGRVLSG